MRRFQRAMLHLSTITVTLLYNHGKMACPKCVTIKRVDCNVFYTNCVDFTKSYFIFEQIVSGSGLYFGQN
ncbi:unnamed protein product [Rhizophagus irregularis]|nr:unnamed protein product [Rhizophagus irregularis]